MNIKNINIFINLNFHNFLLYILYNFFHLYNTLPCVFFKKEIDLKFLLQSIQNV